MVGELIKKCLLSVLLYNLVLQVTEAEQSSIEVSSSSLKVYWNVPSFECDSFKINFTTILDKCNIIHNEGCVFKGEKITILYDPGDFPALLTTADNKLFYRNGGVPQEGDLALHLEALEESITSQIPSKDYSGLAVIDFESWRPIFRQHWGSIAVYKDVSVEIERQKHPTWNDDLLTKEATKRLEAAGQTFMEESLNLAKKLRPKALWGYYHYPYSFTDGTEDCASEEVQAENDRISWLWKDSDALYPSVYMQSSESLDNQIKYVQTSLDEVFRIRKKFNTKAKVYVYVTYMYTDTETYVPKNCMTEVLKVIASYDVEGAILWGASSNVGTKAMCQELYNYIPTVFG